MNIIPINNIGGGVIPLLNNKITNIENNINTLFNNLKSKGSISNPIYFDSNGIARPSSIIGDGPLSLCSNQLSKYSINSAFTYSDLVNIDTVVFFTNWYDDTHFPRVYGSGVLIPGLDNRCKYILYLTSRDTYLGTVQLPEEAIVWTKVNQVYEKNVPYSISRLTLFGFGLNNIHYFNFPNVPQGASNIHLEPYGAEVGALRYYKDDSYVDMVAPLDIFVRFVNIDQAACMYMIQNLYPAPSGPLIYEVRNVNITIT